MTKLEQDRMFYYLVITALNQHASEAKKQLPWMAIRMIKHYNELCKATGKWSHDVQYMRDPRWKQS